MTTHRWMPPPFTEPRPVTLTAREADVLDGVCQGFTNRRIARILGTTENTVKSQVKSLLAALDARDRAHAAALAATGAVDITVKPRLNRRAA